MRFVASFILLLSILLLIATDAVPQALAGHKGENKAVAGGWTPIKNVNDAHIKHIAEFAVTKYNEQAKTHLSFTRVVSGETQLVAGTNYRLVLEASDDPELKRYKAVVWETLAQSLKLTSFKPVVN